MSCYSGVGIQAQHDDLPSAVSGGTGSHSSNAPGAGSCASRGARETAGLVRDGPADGGVGKSCCLVLFYVSIGSDTLSDGGTGHPQALLDISK